jgi:hypothetical protein
MNNLVMRNFICFLGMVASIILISGGIHGLAHELSSWGGAIFSGMLTMILTYGFYLISTYLHSQIKD